MKKHMLKEFKFQTVSKAMNRKFLNEGRDPIIDLLTNLSGMMQDAEDLNSTLQELESSIQYMVDEHEFFDSEANDIMKDLKPAKMAMTKAMMLINRNVP